jgi:hypothetical protein
VSVQQLGLSLTTQAGSWTSGVASVSTPSGVIQSTGSRFEPDFATTDHDFGHVALVKPIVVTTNLGSPWAGFARLRIDGFFVVPEPGRFALLALAATALARGLRRRRRRG